MRIPLLSLMLLHFLRLVGALTFNSFLSNGISFGAHTCHGSFCLLAWFLSHVSYEGRSSKSLVRYGGSSLHKVANAMVGHLMRGSIVKPFNQTSLLPVL